MQRFTSAIRTSIESGNWYAALFLALTMPDICSKLETPTSGSSGVRYKAWFDKFLSGTYTRNIMGNDTIFMSSGDCWALRCSLLHEGSDDIGEQSARETLARFHFTTLGSHRIRIENVLVLNTANFCEEMCQAVESWIIAVAALPEVQERIAAMIEVKTETFSPHNGIRIG